MREREKLFPRENEMDFVEALRINTHKKILSACEIQHPPLLSYNMWIICNVSWF